MTCLYLVLNWGFGVLFLLAGVVSLIDNPLGGLCLLAISALLLPPVRNFIYTKTNKEFPIKARAISIFVLFIAFGIFSGQSQERKAQEQVALDAEQKAEKIAQIRQENIDYFKANRETIISSVKSALSSKDYQSALSQSNKYLAAGDKELEQINAQAKNELATMQKAEKTKKLLAELKSVPTKEYEKNKSLYQQLVKLNPDNTAYQQKLDYYSQKLSEIIEKEKREQERLKKEREARIAKFGEPPTQSAWDGSYYAVERYLKRVANDPDSIDIDGCTKVYQTKRGWLVGCDYRGRNAFGGMIRKSNWFTIVHGQVVQMHDASAYKQ